MKKTDARKLTQDQLTDLRKRGVAAVQTGESPERVATVLGVHRTTVYGWLASYRNGGWNRLDARKRGGRKPKLDAKAMRWLYKTITEGNPMQFKFKFALWTSAMVRVLILKNLGISLSRASVCRLLNQLGLSAQRPLWRAYQQNPEAVTLWLNEEFPKIKKLAKRCKASIWFGDEAGVRSDAHSGKTWARKGDTPIISTTGARFSLNLISAVSRQGAFRFMTVKGRVNAEVFIDFLKRLIQGMKHPVFLIVDGHPTHKAVKVRKFIEGLDGQLRLFFLPPYSPELNPDEHVWNDLKNNGIGRQVITGPDQMKRAVISHLRCLQKSPELIRSFFHAPSTVYAA
jgi:transposase